MDQKNDEERQEEKRLGKRDQKGGEKWEAGRERGREGMFTTKKRAEGTAIAAPMGENLYYERPERGRFN